MTILEDEIVNNKAFEHANLIFTEPWTLTDEIMLNIMQNINLIFSKTNFRPTGVYVLSSISKTLHNFSTGYFPMYRGILELKNDTNILRKNGSFSNKTCCGLAALFLKTKIYFCRCNFVNKQTHKNSYYRFLILTAFNMWSPKYFRKCL